MLTRGKACIHMPPSIVVISVYISLSLTPVGPPILSAKLNLKWDINVAAVASKLSLANDCPTQFRGPSANGKYRFARLSFPSEIKAKLSAAVYLPARQKYSLPIKKRVFCGECDHRMLLKALFVH